MANKTPSTLPTKSAAIIAAVGAVMVVAVLYVPALLPVCQALNFCPPDLIEVPATDAKPE